MLAVTDNIRLDENELELAFIRASGPGGQHVNKSSTAVQLSFDVLNSPSLPEDVRQRLVKIAGTQMTKEGLLIIEAKRFRSQNANRQDAINRLVRLIRKAAKKSKRRVKTRPTRASRERRLKEKQKRSERKRNRHDSRDY